MKLLKYGAVFLLGFLIAKLFYEQKPKQHTSKEIQLITNKINNLSKLVVSEGSFAEIYSFLDSKKYFYDMFSFDKKAIISINAKVEVGYDLSKLDIKIDSIEKQIIINKIPQEELNISPSIQYFDLQESQFNTFSANELNKLNKKSIEKIKTTTAVENLKNDAKNRLFEELSKIYLLSKIYGWKVVDNTNKIQFLNNTSKKALQN